MNKKPTDLVVLIPGFLAFDRFGNYPYFSDRVPIAIQMALETTFAEKKQIYGGNTRVFTVVVCPTLPAASLQNRQEVLIGNILGILDKLSINCEDKYALHLIGHSTGGVDAELLTHEHPLEKTENNEKIDWNDCEEHKIRDAIQSVISIAAPFRGTHIVKSKVAQFFHEPRLRNLPNSKKIWKVIQSISDNLSILDIIAGMMQTPKTALKYIMELSESEERELIKDLRPEEITRIFNCSKRSKRLEQKITYKNFATIAFATEENCCELFDLLHELTSLEECKCENDEEDCMCNIRIDEDQISALEDCHKIFSERKYNPLESLKYNCRLNDGIVNTASQFINKEELSALVVADHIDVLGHYPYHDILKDETIPLGLLDSGSDFRDREFLEIYRKIAHIIV